MRVFRTAILKETRQIQKTAVWGRAFEGQHQAPACQAEPRQDKSTTLSTSPLKTASHLFHQRVIIKKSQIVLKGFYQNTDGPFPRPAHFLPDSFQGVRTVRPSEQLLPSGMPHLPGPPYSTKRKPTLTVHNHCYAQSSMQTPGSSGSQPSEKSYPAARSCGRGPKRLWESLRLDTRS